MFLSKKITNLGFRFDGVNDYVNLGNILNFTSEDFSFSFHFKLHTLQVCCLFAKSQGTTGYYVNLFEYNSNWYLIFVDPLYPTGNNGVFGLLNPTLDKLYKVVITRSGFVLKIFVDNVELQYYTGFFASNDIIDLQPNVEPFIIGVYYNSGSPVLYSNITFYDFKAFNKVLTTNEITALSTNDGQVPSTANANILLDCRFNDKQGYTLTDQSGNNYNGTLVNFAAGTTDLGTSNSWKNIYSEPITLYSLTKIMLLNNKLLKGYSYHKTGLQTDGANDYINFGNTLQYTTNDFSFCFKIRFKDASYGFSYLLNQGFNVVNGISFSFQTDHSLLFAVKKASGAYLVYGNYANFTYDVNKTYSIIVTKNTSQIKIFIDNVECSYSYNGTFADPIQSDQNLILGAFYTGGAYTRFNTIIFHDFKCFNKQLNTTEIAELYNTNHKLTPATAQSSLQLDCRFDNKQGYTATDKSGLNINGTLINYATGTTDLGTSNSWKDIYGNSITSL